VDEDLKLLHVSQIDRAMVEATAFGEFALECLREAIKSKDVVITNNVITDPSDAPTTNTNFANLRVVVALPLVNYGAIYLDQHISKGIIPKQMVERMMQLITYVIDNNLQQSTVDELYQMYHDMPWLSPTVD